VITRLLCCLLLTAFCVTAQLPDDQLRLQIKKRRAGAISGGGGGSNTFTLVQHKNFDSLGGGTGGSSTATTVAVTTSATGSGNLLAVVGWRDDNSTITSPSASTSQGTWTHCTNCATFEAGAGVIDIWYVLTSTSGATTVTCNFAAGSSFRGCEVIEYSYTPGPISLDTSNSSVSASCTACVAPALTISGTKDVFIGSLVPAASCSSISGAFTNPADFVSGTGYAGAINQATYTAPTWTCSAGAVSMNMIGFK
jgi:hypothetical protein